MIRSALVASMLAFAAGTVVSCGGTATSSVVGTDADETTCGSGPEAGTCGTNEFCQEQTFAGGGGPAPGTPELDSTSYSCQPDPCKGTPSQSCYCSLPSCQSTDGPCSWNETRRTLSCTEFTVCASPDTPIETPKGERPIADIQVGDVVYSVDHDAIRPVLVIRIGRHRAQNHHVVRVVTAEGRTLEISAPHPTADGRSFGDLRAGGLLDGHVLESVEVIPYAHEYTYDILPASDTGTYFAAGMQIRSTLSGAGIGETVGQGVGHSFSCGAQ